MTYSGDRSVHKATNTSLQQVVTLGTVQKLSLTAKV